MIEEAPRQHIRHLADVSGMATDEVGAMEISVTFQEQHPPAGRLRVVHPGPGEPPGDGAACVVFAGWMELLRALDSLLGERSAEAGQS